MTVIAELTKIHTVTFTVNGIDYVQIQVADGEVIGTQMPNAPVVPGYAFKGWKNGISAATTVTDDMLVEADLAKIHTVTFIANGQYYTQIEVVDGEIIGSNLPADPVVSGYAFVGWKDLAGNTVSSATAVTGTMVVVADLKVVHKVIQIATSLP